MDTIMTITINASILDAIERVQYFAEYIKEIPSQTKTVEYDLDEITTSQVKTILCENDINNCFFTAGWFVVTLPLTAEEITEKVQYQQEVMKYWVMRLVKWCEKEEFKIQITQYLDKYSDKYADVVKMMQEYEKSS